MKKNDQPKNDSFEKPNFGKEKVGQTSNISFGQKCFDCQGYGHIKSECPTYLWSKGKAMVVTFSDDEASNHDSDSDQEGKFMAFTDAAGHLEWATLLPKKILCRKHGCNI